MILARCPACSTVFRVRPEQLRARSGLVRCGQCQHTFNALDTLVDEGDEVPAAPPLLQAMEEPGPPPSPSGPLFVLEEKEPENALLDPLEVSAPTHELPLPPGELPSSGPPPADISPWEDVPLDPDDSCAPLPSGLPLPGSGMVGTPPPLELDFDLELVPSSGNAGHLEKSLEPASGQVADERDLSAVAATLTWPAELTSLRNEPSITPDFELDDLHQSLPEPLTSPSFEPALDEAAAPLDFESLIHTRDQGRENEPPQAPLLQGARAGTTAPNESRPPLPASDLEKPAAEADEDTAEEADEEGDKGWGQALWAAAATLLLLTMAAQGVLVFRNEVALANPHLRPFLESLCAGIGCELPLPRESSLIAIESSDIQPDAGHEALFTLHATLRNRAEFQQTWPHLEITLTDARDKALVRRVLSPDQWRPAEAPKAAFPAKSEIVSRVAFEAPGIAAAGYRVYAFYP